MTDPRRAETQRGSGSRQRPNDLLRVGCATDHKRADEEMARLASFPMLHPNPIVEADADGCVCFVNPAARRLFPDIEDRKSEHPWLADWQTLTTVCRQAAADLASREVVVGDRSYLQTVHFVPQTGWFRTYGLDITDRKRAKDALRESEDRLRFAVEGIEAGEWDLDLIDHTAHCSLQHDRIFGYQTLLPHWTYEMFLEHVVPEDRELVDSKFRQAVATERKWDFECRIVRCDREVRWIRACGRPSRDASGKARRVVGIVQDITDRKLTEQAVHANEERYRGLVELSPDAILVNRNNRFTFANPAALRLFGASSADQLLGKSPFDLFHPDYHETIRARIRQSLEGQRAILIEEKALRLDGTAVDVEVTASPFTDREGPGIQVIIRDITERERAEQAILRLNEQLQTANRDLEAFTASVCHDLRSPLHAISGFGQLLAERFTVRSDEAAIGYLAHIGDGVRKMGALIDDLMTLSRVTQAEVRRKAVDLSALVCAVVEGLRKRQPEREVEFVIQEGVAVEGDPHLLRVALENLLGNAWKYTSKHAKARIEFGVTVQGGEQVYFVRDDGAGFDMKSANKLFAVFHRLPSAEEFEGTGVGLATVERIIRAHGGRVWAEAAIERGATFFFTIPKLTEDNE